MGEIFQYLIDALALGSLYALFALGLALVFGVMDLVNFAHGELIMIGAYVAVLTAGLPWPVMIATTIVAVAIAGVLMERFAFRPLRGADAGTLLIASFAVSILVQNVALTTAGGLPRAAVLPEFLAGTSSLAGLSFRTIDAITVMVTALLLGTLAWMLRSTRIGLEMRAAAEDFGMAGSLGVRSNRVIATAFALSGLMAGVAAVILLAQTGTVRPDIGLAPVLFAFIATVIGGLRSLLGAVLGGYLLGVVTVILELALPLSLRSYRDAAAFAVVVIVLLFRPDGLIPGRAAATRV
jgi:branched-chain amino acid transport system permease protein